MKIVEGSPFMLDEGNYYGNLLILKNACLFTSSSEILLYGSTTSNFDIKSSASMDVMRLLGSDHCQSVILFLSYKRIAFSKGL
jgi:hypothetical protein